MDTNSRLHSGQPVLDRGDLLVGQLPDAFFAVRKRPSFERLRPALVFEAAKLVQAGGGAVVTSSVDLAIRLDDWLGSVPARDTAGGLARSVVQSGLGAAERSFDLVMSLLAR